MRTHFVTRSRVSNSSISSKSSSSSKDSSNSSTLKKPLLTDFDTIISPKKPLAKIK